LKRLLVLEENVDVNKAFKRNSEDAAKNRPPENVVKSVDTFFQDQHFPFDSFDYQQLFMFYLQHVCQVSIPRQQHV
jgi:thiamine monophosphate kinase